MSCAACSSRVEKAVSRVPGVTSCSVSLLTNSMGVEGTAGTDAIIKAVQDAGYGASLKGASGEQISASAAEEALEDHETPILKRRLIASVGFRQPHCHGTGTASSCRHYHGHQPEIFYQWI